jgi:hypothetical protein
MSRAAKVSVMTLAFLAVFVGLAPFGAMSVIDGEEERWITTGSG